MTRLAAARLPVLTLAMGVLGLSMTGGCVGGAEWVTVRVAQEATLDLPPVPNAPVRLQVVAYGPEPEARAEPGQCATRVGSENLINPEITGFLTTQ